MVKTPEEIQYEKQRWNSLRKIAWSLASGVFALLLLLFVLVNLPARFRYTADYKELYRDPLLRFFGAETTVSEKQRRHSRGERWKGSFDYIDDYDQWTIRYRYGNEPGCPERTELMENRNNAPLPWRRWLLHPLEDAYRDYVERYMGLQLLSDAQPSLSLVSVRLDSPQSFPDGPEGFDRAIASFWADYFAPLNGGESWPTVYQPDYDLIFTRYPLCLELVFSVPCDPDMTTSETEQQACVIREKTVSLLESLIDYTGGTCHVIVRFSALNHGVVGDYAVVGGQFVCRNGSISDSEFAALVCSFYQETLLDGR